MKWLCENCVAINPEFSYKCHNCGRRHGLSYETILLRELENVVRFCHGNSTYWIPVREEAEVLAELEKLKN